jgi:hypothetical protein
MRADNIDSALTKLVDLRSRLPVHHLLDESYVARYHSILDELERNGASTDKLRVPARWYLPDHSPFESIPDTRHLAKRLPKALFLRKLDEALHFFYLKGNVHWHKNLPRCRVILTAL